MFLFVSFKWRHLMARGVLFLVVLFRLEADADTIYRETFGRPNGATGNLHPTNFLWVVFTNGTARLDVAGVSPNTGNPVNVANTNAGPNADGSFTNCAIGLNYQDTTGNWISVLNFTPEYSFDPVNYVAGSIVFSWYEGNGSTANTYQVALRIGGNWYVSAQTFANTAAVTGGANFGTLPAGSGGAQPMSLTYNPTAANWKVLNFNGNYSTNSGGSFINSSVGLSVGATAGANLSGPITAIGLYGQENSGASIMRFDTFAIDATPAGPPMLATITNLPANGVQGTYANLNGQVLSVGSQTPTVNLYYGPTDGGTNAIAWSNNVNLGLQGGTFSLGVSGLTTNTTYYYTVSATNSAGISWATPSRPFTTQPTDPTNSPTLIQYLSGTDKDNTLPWQFSVSSGRNAGVATTIPVPSCWEMQGFGTYNYGQNGSVSNSETGFYTNTFAVPANWAGKKIFLVFEGAFTDTDASINGQSVGATHRGGFYEFKYDVTDKIVTGASTNVITVVVRRWSTDPFIVGAEEKADYWDFGGIYRPVYLEAKPPTYIDRIAANPLANGNITVNTYLGGIADNYTVKAFVTDTNNMQLGSSFSSTVAPGATNVILSATLPQPNTWSSEFPTLYTLTVQLLDPNNAVVHTVTNQIGFRTVTFVANQGFFINGKKVLMRGSCRHEVWPTTGRTISRAVCDLDIQMMKDMNMNAVRLSHYPNNKMFYEECDRLGLYVLDEFDSYQFVIDTANGARLIGEMVRRDVNHPCIFAWDNGNEGGANANLDGGNSGSTNYFALYDIQNRLVIRPNQGGAYFNGVATDHYELYNSVTNYLRAGAPGVFMPTEMIHGLYDGGGGACLAEIWEAFRTSPQNSGGMFLWAFLDEGIFNASIGSIDVKGQSAPDGLVGPYREKEASYYACKSIFSPVQIGLTNLATFNGTLTVSNRFDFTDLNQCTFNWQLGWFADATDATNYFSTNALTGGVIVGATGGNFNGPTMPPGFTGSLVLPSFPTASWTNYDALRVTATDPFGNNIYIWTLPLRTQTQIRDRILGLVSLSAPTISAGTNATDIIVTNGARIFRFSKTTGVITSLTVSNQSISFTNGPRPVAGSAWPISSLTNYFDGTNYIVLVNDLTSAANGFQWTLRPDGWLKLSYRYTLTGPQENIGITFDYPSNQLTAMNWLGQGPYRIWENRSAGQEVFSHTKTYNNTWTGQTTNYSGKPTTQWAYPEFAGFHGQLFWATLLTTEQPITVATATTNLFFRVATPPATDKSTVNPTFPPGTISLLHGISAMGDKFDVASTIGPSAATNIATGLYTGEANFFFGPLPTANSDRDNNALNDSWELKYFATLGQNALSTASVDGYPLMLENAFDLSPTNNNQNSSRLPHYAKGTTAPAALVYSVPASQAGFFNYTPELSDDLINWLGADQHPEYFSTNTIASGTDMVFTVQPIAAAWPGDVNHLFLRLKIKPKP